MVRIENCLVKLGIIYANSPDITPLNGDIYDANEYYVHVDEHSIRINIHRRVEDGRIFPYYNSVIMAIATVVAPAHLLPYSGTDTVELDVVHTKDTVVYIDDIPYADNPSKMLASLAIAKSVHMDNTKHIVRLYRYICQLNDNLSECLIEETRTTFYNGEVIILHNSMDDMTYLDRLLLNISHDNSLVTIDIPSVRNHYSYALNSNKFKYRTHVLFSRCIVENTADVHLVDSDYPLDISVVSFKRVRLSARIDDSPRSVYFSKPSNYRDILHSVKGIFPSHLVHPAYMFIIKTVKTY